MKIEIDSWINTWDWANMGRDDIIEWAQVASVSYKLIERWRGLSDTPRVLDLGCGAGRNSTFFAMSGFRVSGLDIDANPLQVGCAAAQALNLDIEYRQGDMRRMPYPDNSFDAVYADNILCLTSYNGLMRAISEIRRVLRPGGEAFIQLLNTNHGYASVCHKLDSHNYIGSAQYGSHAVPVTFVNAGDIPYLLKGFDIIDTHGPVHGYKPHPGTCLILMAKRAAHTK